METEGEMQAENQEIDEAYEEYLRANLVRDEELIKFIEDFMISKEFHSIGAKVEEEETVDDQIINCVCSECWSITKKVDLVREAQKIWAIERRFENFLKNKTTNEIVSRQKESIRMIREKIAEAKRRYLCHKEQRDLLKGKRREKVLENLKKSRHVNSIYLTLKSKVIDKVFAKDKIRHLRRVKRKQRTVDIIKKILNEYIRQRQIEALGNKWYDTKVVHKEKILQGLEVIGAKIDLLPRFKPRPKETEEKVEKAEWEEVLKPEEIKREKNKKYENDKKDKNNKKTVKGGKIAKKSKKGKAPKTKNKNKGKNKREKKDKKIKPSKEEVDLLLPYVPIVNDRHKIKPDEESRMENLILEFEAAKEIKEEREKWEIQKELARGVFYPEDTSFFAFPKTLMFQGFKNGNKYKTRLRISNGGKIEKKCRFYLVCLDEFDPLLVQVEPVGTQNVIPGLFFDVTVTFSPDALKKVAKGSIVFLTYQSNQNEYTQICVPLICIPWCSQVTIFPEAVTFDALPMWIAKEICNYRNFKTLKICNIGKKPCKITITKIKDPFQLGETSEDESNINRPKNYVDHVGISEKSNEIPFARELQNDNLTIDDENGRYDLHAPAEQSDFFARKIISEYVDYIFDCFTFDRYFLDVSGASETTLKVYFRNIDHVGSYNEKYLFSIFEQFDGKVLECTGSRVRTGSL